MLKFVQRFADKVTDFLFNGYLTRRAASYDTLLKVMDGQSSESTTDEVRQIAPEKPSLTKQEFFSKALQSGIATICLDPRIVGVKVPDSCKGQVPLILNFSYRYHIADFDFDNEGVVASLSFNGSPFRCVIPWNAVIGVGNQSEGIFYSFTTEDIQTHPITEKKTLSQVKTEGPVFDQISHDRAIERRKQFKIIKGGKE